MPLRYFSILLSSPFADVAATIMVAIAIGPAGQDNNNNNKERGGGGGRGGESGERDKRRRGNCLSKLFVASLESPQSDQ